MLKRVGGFFKKDDCASHYKMGRTLGTGSFATVVSAIHKQDQSRWAIKCINKASLSPEDNEALTTEVQILESVEHPNVVHLKEVFDTPKTFYMVMEIMKGGELFDKVVEKEHYSEDEARQAIKQIAEALAYCHELKIVHRDLKPENLLYQDDSLDSKLKIADFGLAKLVNNGSMMQTACGTPGYVAPEILKGKAYGMEVDLWSVGVIVYILLCGFPPFYDDNNAALFEQIKAGDFEFPSPYWDDVSDAAKDLVSKLLTTDPAKRYTCVDVLKHPWVTGETVGGALTGAQKELKKFNARRKFKMAINAQKALAAFRPAPASNAANAFAKAAAPAGTPGADK